MKLKLKVLCGVYSGRVLTIDKSGFLVGRADECDLRLKSHNVSRHHCRILFENSQVIVEDLGSSNGTYVNGTRIEGRHLVREGDQITIQPLQFEVLSFVSAAMHLRKVASKEARQSREELFDSDVFEWISTGSARSSRPNADVEEHIRVKVDHHGAADNHDTVNIESTKVQEQLAEATEQQARAPRRLPRKNYIDSGSAAADSLQAYFNRRR